jgi:UTP-glucose-1-phosphate uridylyltransferase
MLPIFDKPLIQYAVELAVVNRYILMPVILECLGNVQTGKGGEIKFNLAARK